MKAEKVFSNSFEMDLLRFSRDSLAMETLHGNVELSDEVLKPILRLIADLSLGVNVEWSIETGVNWSGTLAGTFGGHFRWLSNTMIAFLSSYLASLSPILALCLCPKPL